MPATISVNYLGLRLNSPILLGSCPMSLNPEAVRELAIAGAGAIVLPSLFEEQIVHDLMERGQPIARRESLVESLSYDRKEDEYNGGPHEYLAAIRNLKTVSALPVIASLNGCTDGRWLAFASQLQEAGADALEVTLESATLDPTVGADQAEQALIDCVDQLSDLVTIPISVKLSPFHTNLSNLAWRLTESGASGLVCFAHDTSWNIRTDLVEATLQWSLTPASNVNHVLAGLIRTRCGGPSISIAASGGISSLEDVVMVVIAGADCVMLTSEIYRSGPNVVAHLVEGLANYLDRHGLASMDDLIRSRPTPKTYLRADYLKCLTQTDRPHDPTPATPWQAGDRWGHVT